MVSSISTFPKVQAQAIQFGQRSCKMPFLSPLEECLDRLINPRTQSTRELYHAELLDGDNPTNGKRVASIQIGGSPCHFELEELNPASKRNRMTSYRLIIPRGGKISMTCPWVSNEPIGPKTFGYETPHGKLVTISDEAQKAQIKLLFEQLRGKLCELRSNS